MYSNTFDPCNLLNINTPIDGTMHFRWIFSLWHGCSASCGEGVMLRSVHCVIAEENSKFLKVADSKCTEKRPDDAQLCRIQACPQWQTSEWSEVRVMMTV